MDENILSPILAFVSIMVVVVTFVIGYINRQSSERRRRTYEFLRTIIEDEDIHEGNLVFARWIKENRIFPDDNLQDDEDKLVVKMLDFYDLLSDAAIQQIVDEEMFIVHLGGRMRSAYNMTKGYIVARRKRLKRDGLYKPFETFVNYHIGNRQV